jgi:hypothetical protein
MAVARIFGRNQRVEAEPGMERDYHGTAFKALIAHVDSLT